MPSSRVVSPQDPSATLNSGGALSSVPIPGTGTVRLPFVELYIGGARLPLLDVGTFFDGVENPLSATPVKPRLLLIDFNYKLSATLSTGNELSLTILDPQWDFLTNILATTDSTRVPFSVRFGWTGIDDRLGRRYPDLFVHSFSIAYSNSFEGTRLTIEGTDAGFELYTREVSAAFDPETSISKVICDVIEASSPLLIPEVEAITTPVGEHGMITQMSPYKYIKHLLKIAKSGSQANSTYTVQFQPGPLGKTRVVIRSDGVEDKAIKKYTFGREKMGTMIDFAVDIEGPIYLAAGAAKAAALAVNPQTKQAVVATSTQGEDTSADEKKVLRTPIDPGKIYTVPWGQPDELSGFLQGLRQQSDKHTVFCRGTVHGDTELEPTKQIVVQVLRSQVPGKVAKVTDSSFVHTSGVYKLDTVEHIIAAGEFRTLFTGYRNSLITGAEDVKKKKEVDQNQNDPGLGRVAKDIAPSGDLPILGPGC